MNYIFLVGKSRQSTRSLAFSRQIGSNDHVVHDLPGMAVTYYGDEIGIIDDKDISWEDTQDPKACIAAKSIMRLYLAIQNERHSNGMRKKTQVGDESLQFTMFKLLIMYF